MKTENECKARPLPKHSRNTHALWNYVPMIYTHTNWLIYVIDVWLDACHIDEGSTLQGHPAMPNRSRNRGLSDRHRSEPVPPRLIHWGIWRPVTASQARLFTSKRQSLKLMVQVKTWERLYVYILVQLCYITRIDSSASGYMMMYIYPNLQWL